jgi:hypothetical protein
MIKLIKICLTLSVLTFFASCSADPSTGPAAIVLAKDGITATKSSDKKIEKTGEACTTNILGLVTTGNASVEEAMANGNIKTVTSIDRDIKGWAIYIILAKSCTVVRGY